MIQFSDRDSLPNKLLALHLGMVIACVPLVIGGFTLVLSEGKLWFSLVVSISAVALMQSWLFFGSMTADQFAVKMEKWLPLAEPHPRFSKAVLWLVVVFLDNAARHPASKKFKGMSFKQKMRWAVGETMFYGMILVGIFLGTALLGILTLGWEFYFVHIFMLAGTANTVANLVAVPISLVLTCSALILGVYCPLAEFGTTIEKRNR